MQDDNMNQLVQRMSKSSQQQQESLEGVVAEGQTLKNPLKQLICKYPCLQIIDLQQHFSAEQLHQLIYLLDFSSKDLPKECRTKVSSFKRLIKETNLKYKRDKKLYKMLLKVMPNQNEIIFNNERLQSIAPFAGKNYHHLNQLQLSNNSIQDINPLAQVQMQTLQDLDLHSNCISDIAAISSLNCLHLLHLNLSANLIVSISSLHLTYFTHLKILNLNDNCLTQIKSARKVFVSKIHSKLQEISLESNFLKEINHFSEFSFLNLHRLKLKNNNINSFQMIQRCCLAQIKVKCRQKCNKVELSLPWQMNKLHVFELLEHSQFQNHMLLETVDRFSNQFIKQNKDQKRHRLLSLD